MSTELMAALIAALVGGTIGSAITAWSSVIIARSQRREVAAAALWSYQYAISAFAADQIRGVVDEQVSLLSADFQRVRDALHDAYPFAGYLPASARKRLFRGAWIDVGPSLGTDWRDSLDAASQMDKLAAELEMHLDGVFPRRLGDRPRSWWRRMFWRAT